MAGKVVNIKVCSPVKLRSGLTGKYHAICHYSYNLPLAASIKDSQRTFGTFAGRTFDTLPKPAKEPNLPDTL
jgi:hypothetical protein